MKIERQQYQAAYRLGLDRHDGKIGIAEAKRRLTALGNPNSNVALVYIVSRLLNGERYTRALSLAVADDFITWIRRDRHEQGLENSLKALKRHIDYYENLQNVRLPGMRQLLAKHTRLLTGGGSQSKQNPGSSFSGGAILLRWDDPRSRNYIDVLPLELFSTIGVRRAVVHETRANSGRSYWAKCNVTVRNQVAELDYTPFARFNVDNDMLVGVSRLFFGDSDRTALKKVQWKSAGQDDFEDCPFECPDFELPPAPPYVPPTAASGKTPRMVRERPGQAAFRRSLKAAYGNQCCITGCAIPEALEGAHIDRYKAPASDNVRNGLLLRRDVHVLYDKHIIAIDPDNLTVHVANSARGIGNYADIHGRAVRLPRAKSHQPDSGALQRHWVYFQKMWL